MAIQEIQSSGSVDDASDKVVSSSAIVLPEKSSSPFKIETYKRFWIDTDSLASIFPDSAYAVPADKKDNEHYYTSYQFKLRDGSEYSQTEDGFTSNEFDELMAEAQKNGQVLFTPSFHRHKGLKEDWGALSALIPIDDSIPSERYVFAYSQKADNSWVRASISAFEISIPLKDETEKKFIFVNMETADPTKPHPYAKSITEPPFKGFAVFVVNKNGEPVAGGVHVTSHWGGGMDFVRI